MQAKHSAQFKCRLLLLSPPPLPQPHLWAGHRLGALQESPLIVSNCPITEMRKLRLSESANQSAHNPPLAILPQAAGDMTKKGSQSLIQGGKQVSN